MKNNTSSQQGYNQFTFAMRQLRWELTNASGHVLMDAKTRSLYEHEIRKMSESFQNQVHAGDITWEEAAFQASKARNEIVTIFRKRTTPVGGAFAYKRNRQDFYLTHLFVIKLKYYFQVSPMSPCLFTTKI